RFLGSQDRSTKMQWTPEHSQHLPHWQGQRFDMPSGGSLPLHKAEGAFRGHIQHFRYSWANDNISELTASNLLKKYAEKYSEHPAQPPRLDESSLALLNGQKQDGAQWQTPLDEAYNINCTQDAVCTGKASSDAPLPPAGPLAMNSPIMAGAMSGPNYPVPDGRSISGSHPAAAAANTQVYSAGYSNGSYPASNFCTTSGSTLPSPRPSPARSAGMMRSEQTSTTASMMPGTQAYSYSSPPYGPPAPSQATSPGYSPSGHHIASGYMPAQHNVPLSSTTMPVSSYVYHQAHGSPSSNPSGVGLSAGSNLKRKASFMSEDGDNDSGYGSYGCKQPSSSFTSQMYRPYDGYDGADTQSLGVGFQPVTQPQRQLAAEQPLRKYGVEPNHTVHHQSSSQGPVKQSLGPNSDHFGSKFIPAAVAPESSGEYRHAAPWPLYHQDAGAVPSHEPSVGERLKNIEPSLVELVTREMLDTSPPVHWDDVAGLEQAKNAMKESLVWPMLRPDVYSGDTLKVALLFGPPGSGKRLLGKCVAGQMSASFFRVSGSALVSKRAVESEKLIDAMFAVAMCHQPSVIFIDCIEAVLAQQADRDNEVKRARARLLLHLDRIRLASGEDPKVALIGSVSHPKELDDATLGWFSRTVYVPPPDGPARHQILLRFLSRRSYSLSPEEMVLILSRTEGFSGADMASLCYKAFMQGPVQGSRTPDLHDPSRQIMYTDFDRALRAVRASVSQKDVEMYAEWNKQYGSGQ
uniref:Fidgetin n=1 Tax=Petromyzon marinus TaxID=7757 RepID=S4S0Z0_PETMA